MQNKDSQLLSQLRSTLSKMELSLAAINDAIIWINETGKIQWCNEGFDRLVAIPHIQILGKSISDLLHLKKNNHEISWHEYFLNPSQINSNPNEFYELELKNKIVCLEIFTNRFYGQAEEMSIVIVLHDVTEQRHAIEKIKFLAAIPENNPAPVISLQQDNKIIYNNKSAEHLLNHWQNQLGQTLPSAFFTLKDKVLKTKNEFLIEEICYNQMYLFSITPGEKSNYVNIYGTNITERKKAENDLVYLSNHDMLTNLFNRPAFEAALKKEIAKSHQENTSFAILLLDLDNFKTVNDTFGHHIGDQLLITVAKQLQENVRRGDIVARLGGDEFIILLSNIKDLKQVDLFAKNLVKRFNKPFKLENHYFHATISVGVAVAPLSGKDESTLLKNADIALYTVKELGKNSYQFFSDKIHYAFKQRADLETGFPSALEKNEFFLVYQPQYKLPSKEVIGMEVLLRWQHPELGLIMPDEFIPLAEKNGFIINIGEWVLKHACKQFVEWQKNDLIPRHLKFAINLSPRHLAKENFLETLEDILKETNMPPENLELELTETAVMTSAIDLDPILEQLQNIGIKISIDDFGAGYSSLTRLKDLPVSTLKIDKSFIKNLSQNSDDAIIVKSIIALGNSLGLNVIPEGVETEEQLNLLMQYHCSIVQGFYFCKHPLSADEMSNLLKTSFPQASEKT